MATLTKIQVALNHEDPAILIRGLDFFKNVILEEHDAIKSFGYKGRGEVNNVHSLIYPDHPREIVGILLQFRQSSPQLEELFVIWHLPGRDDNRALCASHMDCVAAILHCSHADQDLCKTLVYRVLRECAKSLHMQLTSGNVSLVHSTLGLIIEMCRTSDQNCRDTYQKLMLSSASLAALVQKGKPISFRSDPDGDGESKLTTDTRYMMMLLIITLLRGADIAMASEIFAGSSIFRKAYHNMFRDNYATVELIIVGVSTVLRDLSGSSGKLKYALIDTSFLKSVLNLYNNEDDSISNCAHRFMLGFCSTMAYNSVTASVVACLVSSLQGHCDIRHRELIQAILKCQPHLLTKFVGSIPSMCDPRPTVKYLSMVAHLMTMINSTEIEVSVRSTARDIAKGIRPDGAVRAFSASLFTNVLPHGFGRKDFSKLLMHGNGLVQRMGLLLAISVIRRIKKILGTIYRAVNLNVYLAVDMAHYLPDLELLVNTRARIKIQQKMLNEPMTRKFDYLILLTLEGIRELVTLLPGIVSRNNFDMLKLFDDCITLPTGSDADFRVNNHAHLSIVLDILSSPGVAAHCRWFGTRDDSVKVLSQLLTAADWLSSTQSKRGSLFKLLWLSSQGRMTRHGSVEDAPAFEEHTFDSSPDDQSLRAICSKSSQLLEIVLKTSNMYIGHGQVDTELRLEMSALSHEVGIHNDEVTLAVLEVSLKIAYQFNAELCIWAAETLSEGKADVPARRVPSSSFALEHDRDVVYVNYLPLSPVLIAMQLLSCSNLSVFAESLPTPIRRQLPGESEVLPSSEGNFLSKFTVGFGRSVQTVLFRLYSRLLVSSWAPEQYSAAFFSVLSRCVSCSESEEEAWLVSQARLICELCSSNPIAEKKLGVLPKCDVKDASVMAWQILNLNSCEIGDLDFCSLMFLATLRLTKNLPLSENLSDKLCSRVDAAIDMLVSASGASASLDSKLIDCLSCCLFLSQLHRKVLTPVRLKGKAPNYSNLSKVVEKLSVFVMEIIRVTLCASQIVECLLYCGLHDTALPPQGPQGASSFLTEPCMMVVCAAANAHNRRLQSSGHKSVVEGASSTFWEILAARVLSVFENNADERGSIFFLGWIMQNFCPDLSVVFVNQAFRDGSSFALLVPTISNSLIVNYNDVRTSRIDGDLDDRNDFPLTHNFQSGFLSIVSVLDRTAESVLCSGNVACLSDNLLEFLNSEMSEMAHMTEGRGYRVVPYTAEGDSDMSLTRLFGNLSFYVDPLGLIAFLSNDSHTLLSASSTHGSSLAHPSTVRRLQAYVCEEGRTSDSELNLEDFVRSCLPFGQKLFSSFPIRSLAVLVTDSVMAENTDIFDGLRKPSDSRCSPESGNFIRLLSFVSQVLMRLWPAIKSGSDDKIQSTQWSDALGNLLVYLSKCAKHCLRVINERDPSDTPAFLEMDLYYLFLQTYLVVLKTKVVSCGASSGSNASAEESTSSSVIWGRARTECNSLIKSCLKFSISDRSNLRFLTSLLRIMHGTNFLKRSSSETESDDLWHPLTFLQLLCAHSKFEDSIFGEITVAKAGKGQCSLPILKMLLQELVFIFRDGIECDNDTAKETLQNLLLVVMDGYTGTMSACDRIIYRIVFILDMLPHRKKIGEAVLPFNFSNIIATLTKGNQRRYLDRRRKRSSKNSTVGFGLRTCTDYINENLSQPAVYATLSHYPFSRRLLLSEIEEYMGDGDHSDYDSCGSEYIGLDDLVTKIWRENVDNDSVEMELSAERYQSLTAEYIPQESESLSSHAEYDPGFWLIVIRQALRETGDRSVRQLANSGALSLVVAALGCHCDVARVVALSCMHEIYRLTLAQTADKDVTFRERPQILLLLDFIRNAFDARASTSTDVPVLPGLSGVFCGRAAMHLLQSGHELYGRINKYLLSRPFCDVKDVPLFDFLVITSDNTVTVSERLAAIRLLRDGLSSKADHLTLCRKNAYSKLMSMFPILSVDIRTGHALFDFFEKALSMLSSSRYLIERCDLIAWIRCLMCLRFTENASSISSTAFDAAGGKFSGQSAVGCPIKLITRGALLLRRTIAAMDALRTVWSNSELMQYIDSTRLVLYSSVNEICEYNGPLPFDYFVQIVWCLWDFCSLWESVGSVQSPLSWLGVDMFHKFVVILENQKQISLASENTKSKQVHSADGDSQADLVLSVSMLLAFRGHTELDNRFICRNETVLLKCCDIMNGLIGASLNYLGLNIAFMGTTDSPSSTLCVLPYKLRRSMITESLESFSASSGSPGIDSQLRGRLFEKVSRMLPSLSDWTFLGIGDISQRSLPTSIMSDDFVLSCCSASILHILQIILSYYAPRLDYSDSVSDTFFSVLRWTLLLNSVLKQRSSSSAVETSHHLLSSGVLCLAAALSSSRKQHTRLLPDRLRAAILHAAVTVWNALSGGSIEIPEFAPIKSTKRPRRECVDNTVPLETTCLGNGVYISQMFEHFGGSIGQQFSKCEFRAITEDLLFMTGEVLSGVCSVIDRLLTVGVLGEAAENILFEHLHKISLSISRCGNTIRETTNISDREVMETTSEKLPCPTELSKSIVYAMLFPGYKRSAAIDSFSTLLEKESHDPKATDCENDNVSCSDHSNPDISNEAQSVDEEQSDSDDSTAGEDSAHDSEDEELDSADEGSTARRVGDKRKNHEETTYSLRNRRACLRTKR